MVSSKCESSKSSCCDLTLEWTIIVITLKWSITPHRVKDEQQFCSDLDESFLIHRFKDRILTISVNGKESDFHGSVMKMRGNLLHSIFKIFTHIQCLRFYPYVPDTCSYVIFADQPSMFSSTLVELHINIYSFEHCFDLLDGRFNQLRILVVNTAHIWSVQSTEIDTVS